MTFIVALVFGWEQACLHIMVVVIKRSPNDFERIRVDSQELWLEAGIQPDQVLIDENLPAHTGTGADADRWNSQQLRDLSRGFGGDAFEYQRAKPHKLQLTRPGNQNFYP